MKVSDSAEIVAAQKKTGLLSNKLFRYTSSEWPIRCGQFLLSDAVICSEDYSRNMPVSLECSIIIVRVYRRECRSILFTSHLLVCHAPDVLHDGAKHSFLEVVAFVRSLMACSSSRVTCSADTHCAVCTFCDIPALCWYLELNWKHKEECWRLDYACDCNIFAMSPAVATQACCYWCNYMPC